MTTSLQPTTIGPADGQADNARRSAFSRPTTRTLVSAIELGVLGDILLRAGGLGLNITLWCWALLVIGLMTTTDLPFDRRRIALLCAAAFFAAVPSWRSEEVLVLFSGLAVLVLLVLLTWTAGIPGVVLSGRTIGAYVGAGRTALMHIIAGAIPLVAEEARLRAESGTQYRHPAGAVLRGLLLGAPIVLIFGALLTQADAAYASLVKGVFEFDAGVVASHVLLTVIFAWLGAAYLTASTEWSRHAPATPWTFRIGAIEALTVIALVDALFLSFVLVQARYLFGGVSHVLETVGLTYAEYARRGFFELVVLTVLTLPLLILVTSGAKIETQREIRLHRTLAGALVGLLFLMMGSALSRMGMYQGVYGWTLDRLYATSLMLWMGASILWFAATALRGRPQRFVLGSLAGGLATLAVLAVINPVAAIVNVNAARAQAGSDFDVQAPMLEEDGLPALLAVLPAIARQLDDPERCRIRKAIGLERSGPAAAEADRDWRTARLSTLMSHRAIAARGARVDAALTTAAPCGEARTPGAVPRG